MGRLPYGRKPTELAAIQAAQDARRQGLTLRDTAVNLNDLGHRNGNGDPWTTGSLHRMLSRAAQAELEEATR